MNDPSEWDRSPSRNGISRSLRNFIPTLKELSLGKENYFSATFNSFCIIGVQKSSDTNRVLSLNYVLNYSRTILWVPFFFIVCQRAVLNCLISQKFPLDFTCALIFVKSNVRKNVKAPFPYLTLIWTQIVARNEEFLCVSGGGGRDVD